MPQVFLKMAHGHQAIEQTPIAQSVLSCKPERGAVGCGSDKSVWGPGMDTTSCFLRPQGGSQGG